MRRAAAVLLPITAVFAIAVWRGRGPEPRPLTAPATGFSADRAASTLGSILAEGVPHPIGTEANARVRDRILHRFRELGYETTVQRRFACDAGALCGMVENIIARQPGARRRDAVFLTAHYDSVGAGPGASDDGAGIAAVLETARALQGRRFRNPVAFLVTDGEEAGLLGAEAFMADEALAREVSAVVNVEMRGTHGLSNMFETSGGNRWLIRHLAGALERPQATSLLYTVYTLLPNDTDLTIFKRAGKAAVNFAAVGGVTWYHTPYDDLARQSRRTLQHQGDNALATVRALAAADLDARSRTNATYFDLFGFHLVWWPEEWTLWIAVAGLLLLVTAARSTPPREMTFGVLAAFAAMLFAAVLGFAVSWLAQVRNDGADFVARPGIAIAAVWLAGIAASLLGAALLRNRAKPRAMLFGIAIVWHVIAIALALTLPGVAYLFVVPAVVVAVCSIAGAREAVISAAGATAGAVVLFPVVLFLYDALGGVGLAAIAFSVGVLTTLVAPLFASVRLGAAGAGLAVACAVMAMFQPAYTVAKPRRVSLTQVDDGTPRYFTRSLPPSLQAAARFEAVKDDLGRSAWAAPAPPVAQHLTLSGERNGDRLVLRARSARNADRITILLQGDATVTRVNGLTLPPRPPRFRESLPAGWHRAVANGVDEVVVECIARGPIRVVASDMTFGIGVQARSLVAARDASPAIPVHDGDTTVTRTRRTF